MNEVSSSHSHNLTPLRPAVPGRTKTTINRNRWSSPPRWVPFHVDTRWARAMTEGSEAMGVLRDRMAVDLRLPGMSPVTQRMYLGCA